MRMMGFHDGSLFIRNPRGKKKSIGKKTNEERGITTTVQINRSRIRRKR